MNMVIVQYGLLPQVFLYEEDLMKQLFYGGRVAYGI